MAQQSTAKSLAKGTKIKAQCARPLKLVVENVQLPETITRTVTKSSSRKDKKKETSTKTTNVPFSASLEISKKLDRAQRATLKLKHTPTHPIEVTLSETPKALKISILNRYKAKETRTLYRQEKDQFVQAGEEVAPYCRATTSYWEYKQVPYTETHTITKTEESQLKYSGKSKKPQPGLYSILIGLQATAQAGCSDAFELFRYLQGKYSDLMVEANQWQQKQVKNAVDALQAEARNLETQTSAFSELNAPAI